MNTASDHSTLAESVPAPIFQFRAPEIRDGAAILQLVQDSGVLEPNSCYAYMLMCKDFSESSVVVESGSDLVGFVVGYRPPQRPEALFVWQVGVGAAARRQGLAHRMLDELLRRPVNESVKFVEATIAPSNIPSRRMFESYASKYDTDFQYTDCFESIDFGQGSHEREPLIRIGPIDR